MSKELAKFGSNLPVNPEDLETGLKNVAQTIQGGTGGTPLMRLMRSGDFVYGAENIEVEEGSEWAINPYSLMHGFACWGDGELLDERMVPFTQQPPARGELPDLGWEWNQQVAMQLQCISGEDEGVAVLYKGTSTGLRNAVKELINTLIGQLKVSKDEIVPIVELESDSYQHKKYGQIYFPVFNITKWATMDGVAAPEADEADDEVEDEPEEKPKAKGTSKKTNRRRRRRE